MTFEKFKLHERSALITGAAGLLGIEHASALLECGAKVILTDNNESALQGVRNRLCEKYDETNILAVPMDVSCVASIVSVHKALRASSIRVDVLINNAAIDPKVKGEQGLLETSRLENFPLDQWDLQISVGLRGAFLCSQVFGTDMAENGNGGVIVNIASDLSVIAPDQRLYLKEGLSENLQPVKPITYSVVKAGLIGMTRYLATYWANRGIRCNALSPGGVLNGQSEEFVHRFINIVPLGRMAHRDEYRAAIQFLCSDASSYMNGQNIVMDGGRSVW